LRVANTKIQEQEDEIARLEAQREDLKKGNAAARESLRKASSDIKAMQGACVGAVVQDVLGGLRFRV